MRSGAGRIIPGVDAERAERQAEEVDRTGGGADRVRRFDLARMVALSDGVFAFALTLLVLSISVPVLKETATSGDLVNALEDRLPELFSWVISFAVIGGFWIRHNAFSRALDRVNGPFLVLTLAFLALIAFIPYPTEILGRFGNTAAFVFYSAMVSLLVVVSAAGVEYASRNGLMRVPETEHERLRRRVSSLRPAFFFGLSIPVALLFGLTAGYICWLAMIPSDVILRRLDLSD